MMVEAASRVTSVEFTVKASARTKDGRGAYMATISNHAGATKYRAIHKSRMNLLQNIKWNGHSYPMEQYVSNHRQAADDILECSGNITVAVPGLPQKVEYLIDSIQYTDNTLQATLGLVRANINETRKDFEMGSLPPLSETQPR